MLLGSLCNKSIWGTASLLGIPPPTGLFPAEYVPYLLGTTALSLGIERCGSCVEIWASTHIDPLIFIVCKPYVVKVVFQHPEQNRSDSLLLRIFTNWSLPFWGQQKKTKQQLLQSTLSENGFAHRHDVWQFPSVTCSWVPHSDPMCAVVLAMRERWIPTVKGVRWGMAFISTYLIFFFKFVHFVKKPLSADLNHSFFFLKVVLPLLSLSIFYLHSYFACICYTVNTACICLVNVSTSNKFSLKIEKVEHISKSTIILPALWPH